jgi:GNAT superfamily N-acetyltransferase
VRTYTRWYLEMTAPEQLAPAPPPDPELDVRQAELLSPEFSRFLYTAVGGDWFWVDRLGWDYARWEAYLSRPGVETWVGWVRGTPAGYAELAPRGDGIEIAYFGLLRPFIGRGIGPRLLHAAVARAWSRRPAHVRLSTCELDGPAALRTYQRAGFSVYDRRQERSMLPDTAPGPWPGSGRAEPETRGPCAG